MSVFVLLYLYEYNKQKSLKEKAAIGSLSSVMSQDRGNIPARENS